ncbi:protein EMSY-LIKE 3-like [Impatiens glandulifera]|uniref:protein EMSY-LIKE 3-like n=1 Tax=Impatiens glandulifera TaxID=253017 RepID=UPI001FB0579D|nr:protein EMSY-LIKE 3-like [Impatiens glandulifera]
MFSSGYTDMEYQIHQLEQEAYSAVLRAFKAQADAISWDKEGLITELRKELRVSDDEHRELLGRVNADEILHRIREWRKADEQQNGSMPRAVPELLSSPTVSASRKKQKTFGRTSRGLHNQSVISMQQISPTVSKHGPILGNGGRRPSRPSMHQPPNGSAGNVQFPNRGYSGAVGRSEATEAGARDPFIGKRLMTRWPTDNNFYEAVIRAYRPAEGRHGLVYDEGLPNESWEWVNLKEILPEDIRWIGEDPGLSIRGREEGMPGVNGRGNNEIEILDTDTLIQEVEKVLTLSHPNMFVIENAKRMLKEHEQSLMEVIEKLTYSSDSESDGGEEEQQQQHMAHGQTRNGEWCNEEKDR